MYEHPLAHFKSGMPRVQMRNLYFGGYYHTRLAGAARMSIIYRPTTVPMKSTPGNIHFKLYQH